MPLGRTTATAAALIAAALIAVSGGSSTDPVTPRGLPGLPPPLLGTAVIGSGGRTAAVDSYGDVVDMRSPGPAGRPLVAVPSALQAAGAVPTEAARVARAELGRRSLPLWRADAVSQRYLPGTNVLVTTARFGAGRVRVVHSIGPARAAAAADRAWLSRARPLGRGAPRWARRLYRRSLLVLRALTDRRTGAVVAGARDGWAYVWPRDAGAAALALAAAGYRPEARRVARFLLRLDLDAAARFDGSGAPVPGRPAQGDAAGWAAAAACAAGLPTASSPSPTGRLPSAARRSADDPPGSSARGAGAWRERADYQEKSPGDYLGNALAAAYAAIHIAVDGPETCDMGTFPARRRDRAARAIGAEFDPPGGLVRVAGEPGSGLDSAAAWAVRPFPQPALFPAARRTLLRLAAESGRFGILPSEDWEGGRDPWTAPTAWSAWSLAVLGERQAALRLLGELRRAATPLGLLPERVDARTGLPRSTTPLAWSHAFAILALRALWP